MDFSAAGKNSYILYSNTPHKCIKRGSKGSIDRVFGSLSEGIVFDDLFFTP